MFRDDKDTPIIGNTRLFCQKKADFIEFFTQNRYDTTRAGSTNQWTLRKSKITLLSKNHGIS